MYENSCSDINLLMLTRSVMCSYARLYTMQVPNLCSNISDVLYDTMVKVKCRSSKTIKYFLKILFISFWRGERRKRERNINVWLPLTCPPMGTWSATQACALTGNRTGNPLIPRPVLNPLSHTSQG